MSQLVAIRASIVHFVADPSESSNSMQYFEDGVLLCKDGKVVELGTAANILPLLGSEVKLIDHQGKLLLPGFIDVHTHYPQSNIIASYGEQLLSWLEKYTFPEEQRFALKEYADEGAAFFLKQLLKNGTTTSATFATIHPQAVDSIFYAAEKINMRLIAGKVLMDSNCPEYIRDDAAQGIAASRELIERWHKRSRLLYAITPRFVPTSSPQQLRLAGDLFAAYPDVYLQSHLAENQNEVAWVKELYPQCSSYLDVYQHYGQIGERAIFAHGIWLSDHERQVLAQSGSSLAFCPTSNLFLGSGLFDLQAAEQAGVRVGVATDVGGGTSFSMLQTLNEAYKVLQLKGQSLTAEKAFYLATLGGASSLYLEHLIGNFATGKEADFIIIDFQAIEILQRRISHAQNISDKLFALMILGDDRVIAETWLCGEKAYSSESISH